MRKMIDLDAALAERKAEPIIVRFHGRDWEFPAEVPAEAAIITLSVAGPDGSVDLRSVGRSLEALIGRERLAEMYDLGISLEQIQMLQRELLIQYGLIRPDDEAGEEGGEDDPSR